MSSVLFFPLGAKEKTLLKGRLGLQDSLFLTSPHEVVTEMLDLILKAKRFFDVNALLVALAGLIALAVIASYAWQVRSKEIDSLKRMGASRGFLSTLFGAELVLLLLAAIVLAFLLSAIASPIIENRLLQLD